MRDGPVALAWLLIATLALCGVWDILSIVFRLPGGSVSDAFWDIIVGYPIISLLCGMLIGHLFWRSRGPR